MNKLLTRLSLLRPILAVLVIFIPLYPKFPLFNVVGTFVAIRLDDIIISLSLLIWLFYQLKHRFPILKDKITFLFFAYFLAITVSFIQAVLIYQTDPTNILLLHLFRRFEYMSLFFISLSAFKTTKDFRFALYAFIIASIGVSVYGYGQKYLSFPVVSTMNSEFSKGQLLEMDVWTRISSTFAGHYDFAAYLSVALILIGGFTLIQKNIFIKIIGILFWLNLFNLLNLTASRVSNFALLGGFTITLIFLKKYLWLIPFFLLFTFSILNSKDLNQRLLATIPAIKSQFFPLKPSPIPTLPPPVPTLPTPTFNPHPSPTIAYPTLVPTVFRHGPTDEFIPIDTDVGVARSGEIRFNVEWPRAITAFRKNPIFGTGLGSINLATDNDYLRTLGESGLFGFTTLFLILFYFLIQTIKRPNPSNTIFLGCFITFLINATLIDVFEASKTAYLFWILMGLYYQSLQLTSPRR